MDKEHFIVMATICTANVLRILIKNAMISTQIILGYLKGRTHDPAFAITPDNLF